jgi:hypothetical protein
MSLPPPDQAVRETRSVRLATSKDVGSSVSPDGAGPASRRPVESNSEP